MWIKNNNKGINVIEVIVIIALVGAMVAIAFLSVQASEKKTRDTKRISDIGQIGRLFYKECYQPSAGSAEYDLADIIDSILDKFPEQKKYLSNDLWDPKIGSKQKSYYTYRVSNDGKHCVIYANLEGDNETVTMPHASYPTMGGSSGVFTAQEAGVNGSKKYYQVSK